MAFWKKKTRSLQGSQGVVSNRKEDVLLHIPRSTVRLVEGGKAAELARGDFKIIRLAEENVPLAMVVRVGTNLQWPLTKDEPVVKLDSTQYLFTLPSKDGGFLNYGVSFSKLDGQLAYLDSFLKDNACFSAPTKHNSKPVQSSSDDVDGKEYAPRLEDYNGALAKASAGGTGEIIKGTFMCSNAYVRQVQKGAEMIQDPALYTDGGVNRSQSEKPGGRKAALRRVRELSEMIENLSQSLLTAAVSLSGGTVIRTREGQTVLAMAPGEVLLSSLDALDKVLDALEVARCSLGVASSAIVGEVSTRYGDSAGDATEDAFATAGHALGTAWNLLTLSKAIAPSSTSRIPKNSARRRSYSR